MTTTATKERPILFSAPMVQAILAGRKTQTRRVVKPQPYRDLAPIEVKELCAGYRLGDIRCPYGVPGDRLWVKEAYRFRVVSDDGDFGEVNYAADHPDNWAPVELNADEHEKYLRRTERGKRAMQPGMFMFRSCSRILLEITDVRVDRVQDISEADAVAEGIECHDDDGVTYYGPLNRGHANPCFEFKRLWDSINAKRGYSWDSNPWVWALTFRIINRSEA